MEVAVGGVGCPVHIGGSRQDEDLAGRIASDGKARAQMSNLAAVKDERIRQCVMSGCCAQQPAGFVACTSRPGDSAEDGSRIAQRKRDDVLATGATEEARKSGQQWCRFSVAEHKRRSCQLGLVSPKNV